jgi:biotin synthase
MCYAIPAKLVEIKKDQKIGVIDYFGEKRKVLLDLDDLKTGDYVYAQGGVLIRKIPEKEALEILSAWEKVFFELKKTDQALAKVDQSKIAPNVLNVLKKIDLKKTLKREEIAALFKLQTKEELSVLYEIANNVRQREHGNASCVHGIIEFSNYCPNSCHYCGIRKEQNISRYRLSVEEIIGIAKEAVEKYGFKALVLQSGEDFWYDDLKLETIVKELKKLGILIFLSLGLRSKETYHRLYQAGARAALLKFETSNPEIFSVMRPGFTLAERLDLIKYLKEIGYVLATGFIVGLPGETEEDLLNNILLTKFLMPDMYSFGPLIPTLGTPLEKVSRVSKDLMLKTIAIARLVDSNSNILVTTALETLAKDAKKEALLAGANSLMINVTPLKYRALYSIYDQRAGVDQGIKESIDEIVELLYSLGRAPTDLGKW